MVTILRAAAVALVLPMMAAAAQTSAAPIKIAYVNTQALMDAAPGRAAADAVLQKEADGYRAQVTKLQDSVQKLIDKYTKDEPTMTAAVKDTKGRAIQALEQDLQGMQQKFTQQIQGHTNELMAPITDLVKKVLDDIRTEDGYALILANDPQTTPIVSADKNLDITDRVVSRLKATPASAVKAADPATVKKPAAGAPPAPAGVTKPKPPAL